MHTAIHSIILIVRSYMLHENLTWIDLGSGPTKDISSETTNLGHRKNKDRS